MGPVFCTVVSSQMVAGGLWAVQMQSEPPASRPRTAHQLAETCSGEMFFLAVKKGKC